MKKVMLFVMLLMGMIISPNAMAIKPVNESPICNDSTVSQEAKAGAGCEETRDGLEVAKNLINIVIGIIGVVGVVVIVFAGQRYLTSSGDAGKAKQAKDMLLYGVIGVVVAILSWAIVTFVIDSGVFD